MSMSRRTFLKTSAAGTGSVLLVGCSSNGDIITVPQQNMDDNERLWLSIDSSNQVTVTIPSAEMGQGVETSCAMLVCEELGCRWDDIQITSAPWNKTYNNPEFGMQLTGGSTTIMGFWEPLRSVGASAREMLKQAAAEQWQVSIEAVDVQNGQVTHPDKPNLTFADLVGPASLIKPPKDVPLKSRQQHQLIGKSVTRLDTAAKTNGTAQFGIDVNVEGMRIATIAHIPALGGTVQSADKNAALAIPGVEDVVIMDHAVAVVADTYWHARKGLEALRPKFVTTAELRDTSALRQALLDQLDEEPMKELTDSAQVLDLQYEVPFIAHATMEPMNCTVKIANERCDVWVPSQSQTMTGKIIEQLTNLNQENIHVHLTYLGGGFGRRGESDFVADAVEIAQATGKPIKLIWSREEDTTHDFYRPAAIARYRIGLDERGNLQQWQNKLAGQSILKRLIKSQLPGFLRWVPVTRFFDDPTSVEGLKDIPYLDEPDFEYRQSELPVPVGFWRSVGNSYSGFFTESVIDEVAYKAGQDPLAYRLQHMHDERAKAVLRTVADAANWGHSNHAQGIAGHFSFGSYVAEVVELSVSDDKEITLHKVTIVVDCGIVVNPDTVRAQMEGGMIFGLVAAMEGEINFAEGEAIETNFDTYPMLRIHQIPEIEVILAPSGDAPGGVGEPATPPIAAAFTNAIFAATGERLRSLPVRKAGYRLGNRA